MEILIYLLIGAAAGFLGSKLFSGASNGLLINLVIGIVGGLIGGWLLGGLLDGLIPIPYVGQILTATLGSILLLWILSLIKKK